MYQLNDVLEQLKSSVCIAKFKKADGTIREMRCTLVDTYLPEQYHGKGMLLNETDRNAVPVWDMDLGAWRSFRLDSLLEFSSANLHAARQFLTG